MALAMGLFAVLVLGIVVVAWACYAPWSGGGGGAGSVVVVSPAASPAGPSTAAGPTTNQGPGSAPVRAVPSASALEHTAFPSYGVDFYFPRGWRTVPADLINQEVPYWEGRPSQDPDLLVAFVPPSGEGAVFVGADSSPDPSLRDFETNLSGEMVFHGFAGIGSSELRLHWRTIAGRQGLVSDAIDVPGTGTGAVAVIVGKDRLYYFALVGKDGEALARVSQDYWPALESTECYLP